MSNFCDVLNQCCLMDLGFEGPNFTWNNKYIPPSNVQERLDHFLAIFYWKTHFPQA